MDLRTLRLKLTLGVMNTSDGQKLFPEHRATGNNGEVLDLVLFNSQTCFFCHRVVRVIQALKIPIVIKDIRRDRKALKELMEIGGKRQVPCLFINGAPLYESADIVRFFQDQVVVEAAL